MRKLETTEYNQDYYEEHKEAGLDYLQYGYWHSSYAKMVTEATLQNTYSEPFVVDAGAACGTHLNGFRETGVYGRVAGIDITEHMVKLGRQHFNFSPEELVHGSLTEMPVESGSVSLLHSHQVLEHIPDELTDKMMSEFTRVLRPGGRMFVVLDAIRHGETKDIYMGDPTHVNIKPVSYWTEKLQSHGLMFDIEAYNRFVQSPHGPTEGEPDNFYRHYKFWSAWSLIKL